jgi:16S rRNA (guanine1207-N2)-methyltransferase
MTDQATVARVRSDQPAAGHYFAERPAAASRPGRVELVLPEGVALELETDRGTFSPERVDPGTRALLTRGPALGPSARTLVDVGCGYGPIALALAARAGAGATVWAVDVNERARALCASNAVANGLAARVRVTDPEGVPDDLVVDELWSNPPIRIGKVALHALLLGWLARLRPGTGRAVLVVQKHLGADSLARWLTDQGWPTERLSTSGGYRILEVRPAPLS